MTILNKFLRKIVANLNEEKREINQTKEQEQEQIKNKFEEKQPTLSRNITLSKDGKWLILKTIRTDIIHVNYMQKIFKNGEMI